MTQKKYRKDWSSNYNTIYTIAVVEDDVVVDAWNDQQQGNVSLDTRDRARYRIGQTEEEIKKDGFKAV